MARPNGSAAIQVSLWCHCGATKRAVACMSQQTEPQVYRATIAAGDGGRSLSSSGRGEGDRTP